MVKILKYIVYIYTVTCMIGCGAKKENHESAEKFLITNPLKRDTVVSRQYVCQIHSAQHIELRAMERGYLEKIYVDEGQFIKKGQLMFQIMPALYKAEYSSAEAEVHFAEIEYQNTKQLAETNIVAPNELALAKAKLDKAKAELALAQVHLNFTQVKAPFDGYMDHFHVRLGSFIEEGELLTSLSDNHEMWVYFNVQEAEYLDYMKHFKKDSVMNVELMLANNELFGYPGIVTAIEADFDRETGNIAFRATFPNPMGLLRHGETGNIIVREPLRNALLIPQKTTFEILDKRYVFIVDQEGIIQPREIVVGAEMPHLYEVKKGLQETDNILLEGLRKVKNGDKIVTEFMEPDEALEQLHLHAE